MVKLIWVTRGRSWGFRFLLNGGYSDPLRAYETAFAELEGELEACQRVGERVALRFPDPLSRKDAAGRIIPHDFVVFEPLANDIHTLNDGLQRVWPLVADIYARAWDESPPSTNSVQAAIGGALDAAVAVDTSENASRSAADDQPSG